MNIKPENCVCTKQTHTTNVIAVDYNMAGMGLTKQEILIMLTDL